jgi:hypothetical protein
MAISCQANVHFAGANHCVEVAAEGNREISFPCLSLSNYGDGISLGGEGALNERRDAFH